MKVLNSGDIIHSSMFLTVHFREKKEQNQDHGHGFTYPLNHDLLRLMFRIGSDIFKVIDDHKTPSSIDCWGGVGGWPVHFVRTLAVICNHGQLFRKGVYYAYWRSKQNHDTEHSESTAMPYQDVRCQSANRPPCLLEFNAYNVRVCVMPVRLTEWPLCSPRLQTSPICFCLS